MSNSGPQETEDLKRDIIAGATLGPCKKISRELLRCQITRSDPKKYRQVQEDYFKCLTEYASVRKFLKLKYRNGTIGVQQRINMEIFTILKENQEILNGIDQKKSKEIYKKEN